MTTKTLNTRIQLKYDTLSDWNNSTLKPLPGEVCIAVIPNKNDNYNVEEPQFDQNNNSILSPYAIGIKIGDGSRTFSQLPWIQAIAGDVYAWAKQSAPPSATNISATAINTISNETNVQDILEAIGLILEDKQDNLVFNTEYNSSTNKVATMSDISSAVANIAGATHFRGVVENIPQEGEEYQTGDIVILNNSLKEYIYDGTNWQELGDESSYVLKSATITTNSGLEFSGSLGNSPTINHASRPAASSVANETFGSNSGKYIKQIKVDAYGHTFDVKEGTIGNAAAADIASAIDNTTNNDKLATAGQVYNAFGDLATIATTGNVNNLIQTEGDYLIFNCGDSETLI